MLVGVDYASVDENILPDFEALKTGCESAGSSAGFVIMRAAYGTWKDPVIRRDWRRAKDAGLTCGAYLYLRMKGASPESQVDAAMDSLPLPLLPSDFPLTIDVEDDGLTPAEEMELVTRAWERARNVLGVPPMLYTSDRVWREDLNNLPAGAMVDSPLWLAKPWPWPTNSQGHLGGAIPDPTVPLPWAGLRGNWWIHQYQGDAVHVPGFTNTVDLSRFNVLSQSNAMGGRVTWVQKRLGLPITGWFGPALRDSIKLFQRSHGLVADGVVGPKTFAQLCWQWPAGRPA
jgi:GH25 family lysozyme M1 (1,4-beta-N-acetylmuramidase)